jgi:uncharacterized membrane protein
MALVKASVLAANGLKPSFDDVLKPGLTPYLRFLALYCILTIIMTFAGFLFVIPMFAAAAVFFPVFYIFSDKNVSIADSFKLSFNMTVPIFPQCLIYILIAAALSFVGIITLGIAMIIVLPLLFISGALIYKTLDVTPIESKTAQEPDAQK